MEVKLKVLAGAHVGKQIRLTKDRFVIGRAEECHLRASSDLISRKHCAIVSEETEVVLEDFGSRNGTQVNGESVQGRRSLKTGDRLKIGPLEFEIQFSHGLGQPKLPAVKDEAEAVARSAERKPASVEDSISEWIGTPTGKMSHLAGSAETQTLRIADTTADVAGAVAAEQEAAKGEKEEGGPGKLPVTEKPKSKDSREAAANILREMARRR